MAGTILVNFTVGGLAFVFTFLTALLQNLWLISLERAFYAFLVFFIATYIVRWLIGMFASPAAKQDVGNHIDMVTPEYGGIGSGSTEASENEPSDTFIPFEPPRIERTDVAEDPDKIANIIRRLADE